MNVEALQRLEQGIGYAFGDLGLLVLALTHRSFAREHNERLEFLGDAILDMIISKRLYDLFPGCPEGELTRMRSALVREGTLAELARGFGVDRCLRLGLGELKSGGARLDSLNADAVESIIGAMFIDTHEDYAQVREVVLPWFESRLRALDPSDEQKDPKSVLQEVLQGSHESLPTYQVEGTSGPEHEKVFTVLLTLPSGQRFRAQGTSRRRAEQAAARQALGAMGQLPGARP
ncbi:MAG: ribonuclease III [Succinivibrionaceae bacterium]|nr:ribonuclease III [Succinivibrionaceae bacterium]